MMKTDDEKGDGHDENEDGHDDANVVDENLMMMKI